MRGAAALFGFCGAAPSPPLALLCLPFARAPCSPPPPPPLSFSHHHPAEYSPFLHKLLLLRDTIREDCGLPGGLHEASRPDAYAETDEDVRALFSYRTGPGYPLPGSPPGEQPPGNDLIPTPPLLIAAARGNVDAVHLLLLFGEGVHARRKANERALYVAAEQGNVLCVAALLGRVPLRPPRHPHHIARKLGLLRPTYNVYGPGFTYEGGVSVGPRSVAAAVAGAKSRAEEAAAMGLAGANGVMRASATASAAVAARTRAAAAVGSGGSGSNGALPQLGPIEAQVAQMEVFEADGRMRAWCRGYHMGTYWSLYDTALGNWEALHGCIGGAVNGGGGGGCGGRGRGGSIGSRNGAKWRPAPASKEKAHSRCPRHPSMLHHPRLPPRPPFPLRRPRHRHGGGLGGGDAALRCASPPCCPHAA